MTFKINRNGPVLLEALPRLIARVDSNHVRRKDLLSEYRQTRIGYEGEQEVDRHLDKTHFPGHVEILTNVELQISTSNFIQIDTLILTTSYIFLLEIKNIAGTLEFLPQPPRLQRTLDTGEVHSFNCPAYQLERNMFDFELWLTSNGLPLKTSGAIILAYSKTKVKKPPEQMPIFYARQLSQVLRKIQSDSPIMSPEQLRILVSKIKNAQKPFNPLPLCSFFRINPADLIPGLYCDQCHAPLIRKTRKTWICSDCKKAEANPYPRNVKDYFMLINKEVSNKELRQFLRLKDKYAAHHILSRLPLNKSGQNKATKYHWSKPLLK